MRNGPKHQTFDANYANLHELDMSLVTSAATIKISFLPRMGTDEHGFLTAKNAKNLTNHGWTRFLRRHVAFWRVLARFDVFVMPLWRAPCDLPVSTADGHGFFNRKERKKLTLSFLYHAEGESS